MILWNDQLERVTVRTCEVGSWVGGIIMAVLTVLLVARIAGVL